MMLDQVRNLSHQMRLFGIHEACERQTQIALSQQLHPLEFLRLLLEEELLSRKDRTAKALVTKARFRFRADLEDLDLAFHKDLTKAKIKELCELGFLHNLENLLILGKTGLGKTHLASDSLGKTAVPGRPSHSILASQLPVRGNPSCQGRRPLPQLRP